MRSPARPIKEREAGSGLRESSAKLSKQRTPEEYGLNKTVRCRTWLVSPGLFDGYWNESTMTETGASNPTLQKFGFWGRAVAGKAVIVPNRAVQRFRCRRMVVWWSQVG